MTIPPLAFDIKARNQSGPGFRSLKRDVKETRQMVGRLDADVRRASASVMGIGKAALAGVIGINSFAAAISKMKQGLEQFDRIAKVARQNGLDGEFYQTLAFMAGEASVDIGVLDNALRKFTIAVGEAKNGSGALYTELNRIDPVLLDMILQTESAEDRMRLYADAVANAANAEDKAALVKAAFGQRGADLVRVLELGAGAMDMSAEKARHLGNVIENDVLDQAEEMQNRLGNAADALDKQLNAALVESSPLMVNFYENMAAIVKVSREWITELDKVPDKLTAIGNSSVFADVNALLGSVGLIDETLYQNLENTPPENDNAPKFKTGDTFGGESRFDRTFAALDTASATTAPAPTYDATQWDTLFKALESEKKVLGEVASAGRAANDVRRASSSIMGDTADAARDLGENLSSATRLGNDFNSTLLSGFTQLTGLIDTGNASLDRFLVTLFETVAQAALLSDLSFGGGGGIFNTLLGSVLGGARAGGGSGQPGMIYEVGERGRELFVPDTSGDFISNDNLQRIAGGSQGGGMAINMPLSLYAPGADPAQLARLEGTVEELQRTLPQQIVAVQRRQQSRGTI